jgi:hypothetical protein
MFIVVHVHPGDLPLSAASLATDSLTGLPRMNNLHGNHTKGNRGWRRRGARASRHHQAEGDQNDRAQRCFPARQR